MEILITGAAGFIGSNLVEFFLKEGFKVIGLDNLSTGFKKNIDEFLKHPNFNFVEGDIRNFNDCLKVTSNVNVVLHQAALGSVPRSINDPITSNEVNISGFLNMLEASKQNKVERFVYAASSSTYGDSKELPKKEDNIGKPLSPYAITKYVNELYASIYKRTYDIDTIGLRYFNVFGKKQDPNGAYAAVIPKFIDKFLNGESPVINGDGTYSRDFTYIDNVIQMNYLASKTKNIYSLNQVYNVACGEQIKIFKMAELIREELSLYDKKINDIEIKFGPNRVGDIPHSKASIEKAMKLLKYSPKFDFEKGIKQTVKWFIDKNG